MHFDHRPIKLVIDAASHPIGIMQGKPLGLIMNELVVNALKYAFPGDRGGEVHIKFRQQGDEYVLEVSDNGVGIDPTAPAQGTGLGKRLVRALALQIGGRAEITPGKRGGTECITRWPAFVEQT
jgi:two-component sensor histidine kinase